MEVTNFAKSEFHNMMKILFIRANRSDMRKQDRAAEVHVFSDERVISPIRYPADRNFHKIDDLTMYIYHLDLQK